MIFLSGGFFSLDGLDGLDFLDEVEVDQADETGRGAPNPLTESIMTEMSKYSLYIAFRGGAAASQPGPTTKTLKCGMSCSSIHRVTVTFPAKMR